MILVRQTPVNDGVGPTAPGAPVAANLADTSFDISWPPSSDLSGVAGYRIYIAQSPAAPQRISALQFDTVACSWSFTGLLAATAYNVLVEPIDTFGNVGAQSVTSTITTTGVTGSSLYRNPNNESAAYLQGNTAGNGVEGSATTRQECGQYDVIVLQWKWPSAQSAETTYMGQLRSAHPHLKIMQYNDLQYYYSFDSGSSDTTTRCVWSALNTNGAPDDWKARNAAGDHLAHAFSPSNSYTVNWCKANASVNLNGKNLTDAILDELDNLMQLDLFDGSMFDDCNVIGSNRCIRGGDGTQINWDYDRDSVDENYKSDATFKADWASGMRFLFDRYRERYPGKLININCDPSFWYRQTDAEGCPVRPFSSHPFYANDDISMCEGLYSFAGGFFTMGDATDQLYQLLSFLSVDSMFLAYELYRQVSRPAETNLMGRQIAFGHNQLRISDTATPTATTYQIALTMWGIAKLCGGGYGVTRTGTRPFPIDALCLQMGNRINTETMVTVDFGTAPVGVTRRAPDQTVGTAQFWYAEYDNVLVVGRLDITGLTPGSSFFGDGSATTYTLPSAGVGNKWQRPNGATYVHPTISTLAMQNQLPALFNGADAVSSSLKPLHFDVFRRVPA